MDIEEMQESDNDDDGSSSNVSSSSILDELFRDPHSFCTMIYPRVAANEPGGNFDSHPDQYIDPARGYVSHGSDGILGIVQNEFGPFIEPNTMLIFEQAIRLCYKDRKHANLASLIFLIIMEQCESVATAVREELEELNDPEQLTIIEPFFNALKAQSRSLRTANYVASNAALFIERFTELMATLWRTRSVEFFAKYTKQESETSQRITACDIGNMEERSRTKTKKRSRRRV